MTAENCFVILCGGILGDNQSRFNGEYPPRVDAAYANVQACMTLADN
ncbi:hypothetical protein FHS27_003954 [Rhodopirellula rubra]|uniref:Uncharacterized protein n=1 Tax=Aporhodopirellula rubra TaxID=980271 RepID=A0A7W5E2I8_9BACT|nr:hypothetical protein [Aporhodopirellula rubra]MBB3208127.1 hypothetical protein [Aporhodopirellula rubra]